MSAHTPAPWAVDGTLHSGDLDVISADGRIAMIDDSRATGWNEPTIKANARLIAAAPDLLEAIIALLNVESAALHGARSSVANNGLDVAYHFNKARAAIAKATGENT
jgi:hypothetical protein